MTRHTAPQRARLELECCQGAPYKRYRRYHKAPGNGRRGLRFSWYRQEERAMREELESLTESGFNRHRPVDFQTIAEYHQPGCRGQVDIASGDGVFAAADQWYFLLHRSGCAR